MKKAASTVRISLCLDLYEHRRFMKLLDRSGKTPSEFFDSFFPTCPPLSSDTMSPDGGLDAIKNLRRPVSHALTRDQSAFPLSPDTEDARNGNVPLAAGKDRHSISPPPDNAAGKTAGPPTNTGAASAVGAGSICAGEDAGEQDKGGTR